MFSQSIPFCGKIPHILPEHILKHRIWWLEMAQNAQMKWEGRTKPQHMAVLLAPQGMGFFSRFPRKTPGRGAIRGQFP
jgi:hypothetical protein